MVNRKWTASTAGRPGRRLPRQSGRIAKGGRWRCKIPLDRCELETSQGFGSAIRWRHMRAFQVYLNGKRLCVAGIGDDGVLNVMVDWVAGNGHADLFLRVGGLIGSTDEHLL